MLAGMRAPYAIYFSVHRRWKIIKNNAHEIGKQFFHLLMMRLRSAIHNKYEQQKYARSCIAPTIQEVNALAKHTNAHS